MTALHLAVERGYDAIARLLLEKGAEPNARAWAGNRDLQYGGLVFESLGWTALHQAAFGGRDDIVQLLLY